MNARGGNYAMTNQNAQNCVNPKSTYKCVVKDQGATGDNRIYFDNDTVSLVRQGGLTYRNYAAGRVKRYLAGVLKMKATGKQFLFTNTHLDPYDITARKQQWDEMIAKINSLKGSLPVVAVGDFNTSKTVTTPTPISRGCGATATATLSTRSTARPSSARLAP